MITVLPTIVIDTRDLIEKFNIAQSDVDTVMNNIAKGLAASYAQRLEIEAANALKTTRSRYIHAIRVIDSGKLEATVLLDYTKDPLVKMLEEGASAFDIKNGLLGSSKVKMTKDGRRYITVPFRWGAAGTLGESDAFTGVMPIEVYNVAKAQPLTNTSPGGGMTSGPLQLNQIPAPFQAVQERKVINDDSGNVLFNAYQHRNSLFEGIQKLKDSVTGQNSYFSFRRVSEPGIGKDGKPVGSDPDSWIHPGIQKYALMQSALNNFNLEQEVSIQLNNEYSKLGL